MFLRSPCCKERSCSGFAGAGVLAVALVWQIDAVAAQKADAPPKPNVKKAAPKKAPNAGPFRPGMIGRNIAMFEARLGTVIEPPSQAMVEQLDLAKEQGLTILDVQPESAASKAGIKANDILLEVNGKPIPSKLEDFLTRLETIKPDAPVEAVVLRKGRKVTIKELSLGEAPPVPPMLPGKKPKAVQAANVNEVLSALRAIWGVFGLPGMPALLNLPAFAPGDGVHLALMRNGNRVSVHFRQGPLTLHCSGDVEKGKIQWRDINVKEGAPAPKKYETVDKVPEPYRAKLRALFEAAEKGGAPIQVQDK